MSSIDILTDSIIRKELANYDDTRVRFEVYKDGKLEFTFTADYEETRARDPRPIVDQRWQLHRRVVDMTTCKHCGDLFARKNKRQMYCKTSCRVMASKARREMAA